LFSPCQGAKGSKKGVEGIRKRKQEGKLRKYMQNEGKGGKNGKTEGKKEGKRVERRDGRKG
jgi:hypothetical protein